MRFFEEIPNIKSIDLSENLLIVFNLITFAANSKLHEINIRENRIRCDAQMQMTVVWMKRNNVNVIHPECCKTLYRPLFCFSLSNES